MSYGMISITVISHLRWHSPLWCLTAPKGGMHFLARRAVVWFFLLPQGSIYTGAHKGAHHNPRARGASNLSPLRTFGPKGRQPSSPIGACPYGAHHNPRAGGASNLSPLRTFGSKGRQPSSPIGACPYGVPPQPSRRRRVKPKNLRGDSPVKL